MKESTPLLLVACPIAFSYAARYPHGVVDRPVSGDEMARAGSVQAGTTAAESIDDHAGGCRFEVSVPRRQRL
jgi:hypothetical protein